MKHFPAQQRWILFEYSPATQKATNNTVLAGFPLTAGPHTVINRQRKKITDLLNLLTLSSELIAWGRSRNTRVWAGPVTRMLVPEVRQSWCTAHTQQTSEHNPTCLFLAALQEGAGRGRDRKILVCSWRQSSPKHKPYTKLSGCSGWYCFTCV